MDPETKQAIAYFREGLSAVRAGAYEEAIRWFNASRMLKPNAVPVHINLGYAYEKAGKLKEAERSYREAIRLKPDFAPAYLNLGNVLKAQRRLAEAEKAYLEALRLDPEFARAHNNLAWLWVSSPDPSLRRLEEALAHAKEAVRLTERMEAGPLDTLAEVHYAQGRCLQAIWIEQEALEADPQNPSLRRSLKRFKLCRDAKWAARDGDKAKARQRWLKILKLAPNDWRAQMELARLQ
jgi:Flp pilus assembly protein TadD